MFRHNFNKQSHHARYFKLLQKAFVALRIISCAVKFTDTKGISLWTCHNKQASQKTENKCASSREGGYFERANRRQYHRFQSQRALPYLYWHRQYHTTEHCHFGTGTESITQQNTATLVQALTVSHNTALPHWYRHWQYHITEHCHIGTGTDSITQQSTATLVQALTVSHNKALPHWYRHWQ